MFFDDYGTRAYSLAIYPRTGDPKADVMYPVLGLNGEAGEVAEVVKRLLRGKEEFEDRRETFIDELGDVLWYLNACAIEAGVTLEVVASRNLEKLFDRKDRGVLHGSGSSR